MGPLSSKRLPVQMGVMDRPEQDPSAPTAAQPTDATVRGAPRSAPPLTKLNRPALPPASTGVEEGGPSGLEPTRFGDWERKGRVSDF